MLSDISSDSDSEDDAQVLAYAIDDDGEMHLLKMILILTDLTDLENGDEEVNASVAKRKKIANVPKRQVGAGAKNKNPKKTRKVNENLHWEKADIIVNERHNSVLSTDVEVLSPLEYFLIFFFQWKCLSILCTILIYTQCSKETLLEQPIVKWQIFSRTAHDGNNQPTKFRRLLKPAV